MIDTVYLQINGTVNLAREISNSLDGLFSTGVFFFDGTDKNNAITPSIPYFTIKETICDESNPEREIYVFITDNLRYKHIIFSIAEIRFLKL